MRELLPTQPIDGVSMDPWWIAQIGYITEDDVKVSTQLKCSHKIHKICILFILRSFEFFTRDYLRKKSSVGITTKIVVLYS